MMSLLFELFLLVMVFTLLDKEKLSFMTFGAAFAFSTVWFLHHASPPSPSAGRCNVPTIRHATGCWISRRHLGANRAPPFPACPALKHHPHRVRAIGRTTI